MKEPRIKIHLLQTNRTSVTAHSGSRGVNAQEMNSSTNRSASRTQHPPETFQLMVVQEQQESRARTNLTASKGPKTLASHKRCTQLSATASHRPSQFRMPGLLAVKIQLEMIRRRRMCLAVIESQYSKHGEAPKYDRYALFHPAQHSGSLHPRRYLWSPTR